MRYRERLTQSTNTNITPEFNRDPLLDRFETLEQNVSDLKKSQKILLIPYVIFALYEVYNVFFINL